MGSEARPTATFQKGLLDKLGIREGHRVSVLGLRDEGFLAELRARGADVSTRRRKASDAVLWSVQRRGDLAAFDSFEPYLRRDGAVWAVFPKGRKDPTEVEVIRAGVDSGLVDTKVVRFSDTHTALKFVIPRARR